MNITTNSPISATAKARVRMSFNPSGESRVDRLKTLAAQMVTEMEELQAENADAIADATVAIRHIQTASMWAVFAATTSVAEQRGKKEVIDNGR